MQKLNKQVFLNAVRQGCYVALILALILGVRGLSYYYKADTFEENGMIENFQLFLLGITTFLFALSARKYPKDKALFFVFASLSSFAMLRELDHLCDMYIPFVSWKIAYVFPVTALYIAWRKRQLFIESLNHFLTTPVFYLMIQGVVISLIIAQAVGDKRLVGNVIGYAHMRETKEMFEEMCELIGYFILFLSSFESFFYWKKKN